MNQYIIRPRFEKNVSERTTYTDYDGTTFTVERYYQTVDILMKFKEEPVIDIDCVFGANMIEYLTDKYPGCELKYSIFHICGIQLDGNEPEDVWTQLKEDPSYDPTEDDWNVYKTELWGYTKFDVYTQNTI
jgi:hypothetical protein